jgi:Tripartite tricarboxylate transporter TctB family
MARISYGELALAVFFAVAGVLWIAIAAGMPLWQGFAPNSGFLPLLYGVLLTGLSAAIVASMFVSPQVDADRQPILKPLLLLGILAATVVGIGVAGFAGSIFLMLVVVFAVLERLPLHWSVLVAAATTASLVLIFKVWLGVPLPLGPLGISG